MQLRPVHTAITLLALLAVPAPARANCGPTQAQVMIVLDRSSSMTESAGSGTKWSTARTAVANLVGYFQGTLELGIMLYPAYPDQGTASCAAGTVNVAPSFGTASAINGLLSSSYPKGLTPSTATLDAARGYLSTIRSPGKAQYVIFITDGKETCASQEPKTATAALLASGIKTFVVGFGSGVSTTALTAAAQSGGTGNYYQANDPNALMTALSNIGQAISCCGNGRLDPGERCDTAIPVGAPGGCPTHPVHCDDKNPLTQDTISGSGCQAACTNNQTSQPQPPPPPPPPPPPAAVCGDGKLDLGEACDIAIPLGAPGSCPTSCDDGDFCTVDTIGGGGCASQCMHTPRPPNAVKDGCCAPGMTQKDDPDCLPACGPDRQTNCVDPCHAIQCGAAEYCNLGVCLPFPTGSAAGPSAPQYQNGVDRISGAGCSTAAGEPAGLLLPLLLVIGLALRRRRD
ncbi:MAG: VWA domain-containing protein [Myxococcales bacterium]|nr:VWA domain-containing protein [Myxococcales bacterium]